MRAGLIWAPLVALAALASVAGLRHGTATAALTETDAIERGVTAYLAGGDPRVRTDCAGVPGQGRVWIEVVCGPLPFDPARHHQFGIDRQGRLIAARGPADWARGAAPVLLP